MKKTLKITTIIALVMFLLFQFGITWHRQEGNTMANTIKDNELVWVNKLATGAWFLGMKLPGFCALERNDLVYFAFPLQVDEPLYEKTRMTSRIAGLPGDVVEIKLKDLIVNNEHQPLTDSAKITYRIVFKDDLSIKEFKARYNLPHSKKLIEDMGVFEAPLTATRLEKLKKDTAIDYVRELKTYNRKVFHIFPDSHFIGWSRDIFGPVKVPAKGDVVHFSFKTLSIYREIIEIYENNHVYVTKGEVYINNVKSNSYTIQNDYYFVLDDNRDHMDDSRKWGFLPKKYILGKIIGKQ